MATVSLPLLFEDLTGGARAVEIQGHTLSEILTALDAMYPGLRPRICDGQKTRPSVALVVDGRIAAQGLATPVGPQSQVSILPAFGGG